MEYFSIITSLIQGKSAVVTVCVPSPITVTPILMSKGTKNSIYYVKKKGINLTCCISLTFSGYIILLFPFKHFWASSSERTLKHFYTFNVGSQWKKKKYPARCAQAANTVCTNVDTITVQTAKHNQTS